MGSSPRMRGTFSASCATVNIQGIIPAYAGNIPAGLYSHRRNRDHPRVCGEHVTATVTNMRIMGSSPRMRGTCLLTLRCFPNKGIIPAYAGNIVCLPGSLESSGDHPRVCGEHLLGLFNADGSKGSSPRMRGTLPS